jgi:hypothetical protein
MASRWIGVPATTKLVPGSPMGNRSLVSHSTLRSRWAGLWASPRLLPSSTTTSVGRRSSDVIPRTRPPLPAARISHPFRRRTCMACHTSPRPQASG